MTNTETSLLQQLLTLLQQQLGQGAPSSSAGTSASSLIPLLQKLLTELQGSSSPSGAAPSATTSATATPAAPAASSPTQAPANSNPADGISGAEISAMLNAANGTGPEVIFSDYDTPASSMPVQSSPTTGGQVAALNQQVGSEAA